MHDRARPSPRGLVIIFFLSVLIVICFSVTIVKAGYLLPITTASAYIALFTVGIVYNHYVYPHTDPDDEAISVHVHLDYDSQSGFSGLSRGLLLDDADIQSVDNHPPLQQVTTDGRR